MNKKTLGTIVLASAVGLTGCIAHKQYVEVKNKDLNGDGMTDFLHGGFVGNDYILSVTLSNLGHEGMYAENKVLAVWDTAPESVKFLDIDGDGDLDLLFTKLDISRIPGVKKPLSIKYNNYMVLNEGDGNFAKPQLFRP